MDHIFKDNTNTEGLPYYFTMKFEVNIKFGYQSINLQNKYKYSLVLHLLQLQNEQITTQPITT